MVRQPTFLLYITVSFIHTLEATTNIGPSVSQQSVSTPSQVPGPSSRGDGEPFFSPIILSDPKP